MEGQEDQVCQTRPWRDFHPRVTFVWERADAHALPVVGIPEDQHFHVDAGFRQIRVILGESLECQKLARRVVDCALRDLDLGVPSGDGCRQRRRVRRSRIRVRDGDINRRCGPGRYGERRALDQGQELPQSALGGVPVHVLSGQVRRQRPGGHREPDRVRVRGLRVLSLDERVERCPVGVRQGWRDSMRCERQERFGRVGQQTAERRAGEAGPFVVQVAVRVLRHVEEPLQSHAADHCPVDTTEVDRAERRLHRMHRVG